MKHVSLNIFSEQCESQKSLKYREGNHIGLEKVNFTNS